MRVNKRLDLCLKTAPHIGTDGQTAVTSAKMPNCRGRVDAAALGDSCESRRTRMGDSRGITLAFARPRNIAVLEVSRRQALYSQAARVPQRASQKPSEDGFRVEAGFGAVWTGFRGAIKVV